MKDNPDYKGDWSAKRISNPEYKGVWEAKKIDNPEFVDDDAVYKYAEFGFIGFDLWQVKAETIFDNIIITDDKAEADAFAGKWKALSEVEKAKKKEADDKKKEEDAKKESDKKAKAQKKQVAIAKAKTKAAQKAAQKKKLEAECKEIPEELLKELELVEEKFEQIIDSARNLKVGLERRN